MIYRITEFAKIVGYSASGIRKLEEQNKFVARRNSVGQRYYDDSDVKKFLNISSSAVKRVVVYSRVSSPSQKPDLSNQIKALETFCLSKGIAIDDWVSEIGGGMNFKRPKFIKLMQDVSIGGISKLIIAHKDRLVRFGFEYFQNLCENNNCDLIILNQETLSPQEEMVEDLMAIVHTFSCRLYGLRNYKKDIKKALDAKTHNT